jgi:purine-binding chemotaxis protein CheW
MDNLLNNESYILLEVAGTSYAIHSQEVQHMELVEHVTPVPNAPPFFEGVVYSRGQVVPTINLRLRFGLPRRPHTVSSRLIVVQVGHRRVGLIVDSAREFRRIPAASVLPPDQALGGMNEKHLRGIAQQGDRLIFILNIAELLKSAETEEGRASAEPVLVG